MAKIRLELNEPIEGVLRFGRGKHYDSQYGRAGSTMFTLQSGDVLFIDEDICDDPNALFANAHVGVGDIFRLTLRKRQGARYYEVRRLSDAAEVPERSASDRHCDGFVGAIKAIEPSKLERDLEDSIREAQRKRATAATPSKVQPSPVAPVTEKAVSQQESSHPIAIVPPARPRAGSLMASALVASIDAFIVAQEYGAAKGFVPGAAGSPSWEDIRAIAATLYIQHGKESQQGGRVPYASVVGDRGR